MDFSQFRQNSVRMLRGITASQKPRHPSDEITSTHAVNLMNSKRNSTTHLDLCSGDRKLKSRISNLAVISIMLIRCSICPSERVLVSRTQMWRLTAVAEDRYIVARSIVLVLHLEYRKGARTKRNGDTCLESGLLIAVVQRYK